jgi:hypothetical protein
MEKPTQATPRRPRVDPMRVWRWGFSAVLIGIGLWLIVTGKQIAGAEGRILGYVIVGYALLRLALGYLGERSRRKVALLRLRDRSGESA